MKALCQALARLLESLGQGQRLNGSVLYWAIDKVLKGRSLGLSPLVQDLESASWTYGRWLDDEPKRLPQNFPPVLVPVLTWEVRKWLAGQHFNPGIHLVRGQEGPMLKVW